MDTPYKDRSADRLISEIMSELPALMIVGPRASGKTTSAARHAASVVRLDSPGEAAAFRADPDAALRKLTEPVLLDEWQEVPEVLGAVKRAVDGESQPGRFILTGSVKAALTAQFWPGTGRVVSFSMYGLTIAEIQGRPDAVPLLDRLADGEEPVVPKSPPDLREYLDLALRSGFPEAVFAKTERARVRWLAGYLDQILHRDAAGLADIRNPDRLHNFFEAYALNSAGIVLDKTLYEAAGITRRTAVAYEDLLVNLMVAERLQAWSTNRLKRLVKAPKRYLIDAALMATVLQLDAGAIMRDGNLLGRILDTFVISQLRASVPFSKYKPRLYHLRRELGRHEVDVLAEYGTKGVIGMEIKATSAPKAEDAKHLFWLRDELGKKFLRGVVFHTGPRVFELGERVLAVPIAALWG